MGDIEQRQQGEEDGAVVRVVSRIDAIPAAEWDACARGADSSGKTGRPANPFISHAFLHALEESGSAARETGWLPQHLVLEDAAGGIAACMPCYLKSHSYGEYVFDHAWADAYERAGGSYYPKLQASVPFTPVTGPRLLVREGPGRPEREALLLQAGATLTERLHASSLHITFPTREEWELAGRLGFLQRNDQQFHWRNENYAGFEDFLGALASRKRKAIRGERKRATEGGIEIEWVTGADLTEAHWDAFFAFYMDTGSRKWGTPYLTRSFFSLIGETHARRDPARACQAEQPHHRRRAELHRRRRALWPLLGGARGAPLPAFRGLLLPGHRLCHCAKARRASRPARKARTSSPAAICRCRPTAPIGSGIPACAAPSPIT